MGVSQTVEGAAATRAVGVSAAMLQQKASDLVRSTRPERVMVLRARPEWRGGDLKVGDTTVKVALGISQLGILDVLATLDADDYAIVLTDRPRADLGDAILARAYKNDIQMPDEWQAVPRLFGAREVSRELRTLEWAATALLDHQPVGGWPVTADVAVTETVAIQGLLNAVLGLDPSTELDSTVLMSSLGRRDIRSNWATADEALRRHLIEWVADAYGTSAEVALKVAQRQELVTPLAVALALDVLWPDDGSAPAEEQVAARVRVERLIDGKTVPVEAAKSAARIAKAIVLRAGPDSSGEVAIALQQAEALLKDIGWAAGADRSAVLRPGYRARVRALAASLQSGEGVEDALAEVHRHRDAGESSAPDMAVRLHRWLSSPESAATDLAGDLSQQINDGAWVDSALGAIWNGSDDPAVAAAYADLATRARARRAQRDETAAQRLGQAVTNGPAATLGNSAIGVERVLTDVVAPWRSGGALLVVLDGFSSAVATSLAMEIVRVGLVEFVPAETKRRVGAVAALPSLTSISRTSLFSGRICSGNGEDERKALDQAFPGSRTFHKDGLRSEGGAALPPDVLAAIGADAKDVPVVGIVINAIDDAVHKNDVSNWVWGLAQLAPLRALLDAAVNARRTVIVTSDHGHVVERASEALTAADADARWRTVGAPATAGEVVVSGPRVVTPSGEAVLLWREDAHFGPRRAGYHGGASLAEVTVPVLVFQPATVLAAAASGWVQAPPQTPEWWNDPIAATPAPEPVKGKPRKKAAAPEQGEGLFSVDEATTTPVAKTGSDVVDELLASSAYVSQRGMAGRRALSDPDVARFLRAIITRGFRAHRDTVAAEMGVPAVDVGQQLAAVKRLLNIDGYDVLSLDSDGVTYKIDEALLRDQFGLRRH